MRKNVVCTLAVMATAALLLLLTVPARSEYCCSCDLSQIYYYCMQECGWDPACSPRCTDQWLAAESACVQSCPGPVC
jgi:hypothetical protein